MVEDDKIIRDAVKEILEISGYAVDTAIHGRDALDQITNSAIIPALIVLDLNMPVMSGKVFLEKLWAQSQELARIPVLVMTALPGETLPGVAGTLSKPFRMRAIVEQVRKIERQFE